MAKVDETVVDENTDVATTGTIAADVAGAIAGLNDPSSSSYSSIKGDTFAGKRAITAALTSSVPLADNLNKEIALKHIIVQAVQIADATSGEMVDAPRVILIDADGAAYHATSVGVLSAVRSIISTMGEPNTWGDEALPVNVVEKRGRNNYRFMTIEVVN